MKYQVIRQITFPTGDAFPGQEIELDEEAAAPLLNAAAIAKPEKSKPEAKEASK